MWRKCEHCGKCYISDNVERKYCSDNCCSKASYRRKHPKVYKTQEDKINEIEPIKEEAKPVYDDGIRRDSDIVACRVSSGLWYDYYGNVKNKREVTIL